ncbi:survival protein sure-like phosphatase/nucleotidase [Protomyces lactucae-debilis]|uniref:Survival protein sure-like phosphatase/nucleotidase n=1 Tax=Protomyces lactucae-debilis TaxID=2754530 RepID=A0A1Y2FWR9_PROLT|nr:survival protein sure-like phosphatase/nucleotidase [Protomyces lactucae-debilis]ORY87977.1 survival protein sure-like phosphatase/nucleotidase [Protomyces lactucae-debilis]
MHVLMTNDDGPPAPNSSPYIFPLFQQIKKDTDWKTTVVLPDSQKSWISKAIFINDKVLETFYDPETEKTTDSRQSEKDWTLLTGTPATCSSIGIHHICQDKPDLILSGPNYGRNTSSIAALASGTLGAAFEGAGAGVRAIAISYAFWDGKTMDYVEEASALVVKLCQYLYANWDEGVDVYSINVPLCKEMATGEDKILWTHIHQAQHSPLFQETRAKHSPLFQETRAKPLDEHALREAQSQGKDTTVEESGEASKTKPRTFEFRPRFQDLQKSINDEQGRLSDTWAVAERNISVTPLRANFMHQDIGTRNREIKL